MKIAKTFMKCAKICIFGLLAKQALCNLHRFCQGGMWPSTPPMYTFFKIDVDGPEGQWLEQLEILIAAGRLRVQTIVIECHSCDPRVLQLLQRNHGYSVYLLDMHIDRKFLDARGVNVFGHDPSLKFPEYLEELYSIRFMRHVYRFKPGLTLEQWTDGNHFRRMYCNQYVFTQLPLLEPRREHPDAVLKPSFARRNGRYSPPKDGIGVPA